MLHVYSWCSEIGRLVIRKDTSVKRPGYLPEIDRGVVKALSWIIALTKRLDLSLERVLLDRFPGVCPHCVKVPCNCEKQGRRFITERGLTGSAKEVAAELAIKKSAVVGFGYVPGRIAEPISFSFMIRTLSDVYPGNATLLHRGNDTLIVAKLLEECGEIFSAYCEWRQDKRIGTNNLSEEIADLTAWLLTCWDIDNSDRSIDGAIADIFNDGCPKCHNPVCDCKFLFTSLMRTTEARRFKDELGSLSIAEDIRRLAEDVVDRAASAETAEELSDAAEAATSLMVTLPDQDESADILREMTRRLSRFIPV